jgi:hypothetical protein
MKFAPITYYVLDAEHHVVECDVLTWGRFFERLENRIVDYTEIVEGTHVSTIFLGIDHRHWGNGPPILFETMIFGGPLTEHQWRYASWDDAQAGHDAAVRKARAAIGQKIK